MLWTNTQDFSSIVHFLSFAQNFRSKQLRVPSRTFDQPRENRDSCSFTSTVVPQKAENLICIHFDIYAINRFKAIFIDFLESRYS